MDVSAPTHQRSFLAYGIERLEVLCQAARLGEATTELALRVFQEMLFPWGNSPIGKKPGWMSDVGDDHTPYEFSMALGGKLPEVRILVEAQGEAPSLLSFWEAGKVLSSRLARDFGADLRRAREIEDLFVPEDPSLLFSMWHAASFWPGRAPEFKVYYNLQAKGRTHAAALLDEVLCRLGYPKTYPRYAEAALARGPELDELKYFSLDLASHEQARIKLYVRHHEASAQDLARVIGGAGGATPEDFRDFCQTILGTEGPFNARPFASCLAFTQGDIPSGGTLYAPLAYYLHDDTVARARLGEYLKKQGLPFELYAQAIKAFARRPLAEGVGLHSYASFKREKGAPKITIYFAPEAYEVFAPGSVSSRYHKSTEAKPLTELVARYEEESITAHPLFRRLAREPVDISKIWTVFANGREAIGKEFSRWLSNLIARVEDDRIRSILAKQLNDELGNGDPSQAHLVLYDKMLSDLSPWRPNLTEKTLSAGRRMAEKLGEFYTRRPAYEGVGATMVVEIYGKQADKCMGDLMRRQKIVDPASLTWLKLHEELEEEHAQESMDLARFAPSSGEGLAEVQRGAQDLSALVWRFFDWLYDVVFAS